MSGKGGERQTKRALLRAGALFPHAVVADMTAANVVSLHVKGPAVFLASAAADYVHGTILTVDGGWMGR